VCSQGRRRDGQEVIFQPAFSFERLVRVRALDRAWVSEKHFGSGVQKLGRIETFAGGSRVAATPHDNPERQARRAVPRERERRNHMNDESKRPIDHSRNEGEGNKTAGRQYNEAQRRFVPNLAKSR